MSDKSPVFVLFIAITFLFLTTLISIAEARGGRGGGGRGEEVSRLEVPRAAAVSLPVQHSVRRSQ